MPPLSAVYSRICLTNGDWPLHLTAGRYPWAAGFYDMNADTDHCTVNSTALPEMLKPLGCERSSTPRRLFRFHPVHALPPLALSPPLSLTTSVALGLAGVRPHARARQVGHWLLREEVLRHVPRIRHLLWLLHRLRGRLLVSRRFRRLPQHEANLHPTSGDPGPRSRGRSDRPQQQQRHCAAPGSEAPQRHLQHKALRRRGGAPRVRPRCQRTVLHVLGTPHLIFPSPTHFSIQH